MNKSEMIDILREEYEKRVDYYINLSEIETKDKNDNDLIASAKGLKVKDKAGFMYTVYDVIQKDGETFIRLLKPGSAIEMISEPKAELTMNEFEEKKASKKKSEKEDQSNKRKSEKNLSGDILPKNKSVEYKRSFDVNMTNKSSEDMYGAEGEFIDVPAGKEFEDNFSL